MAPRTSIAISPKTRGRLCDYIELFFSIEHGERVRVTRITTIPPQRKIRDERLIAQCLQEVGAERVVLFAVARPLRGVEGQRLTMRSILKDWCADLYEQIRTKKRKTLQDAMAPMGPLKTRAIQVDE